MTLKSFPQPQYFPCIYEGSYSPAPLELLDIAFHDFSAVHCASDHTYRKNCYRRIPQCRVYLDLRHSFMSIPPHSLEGWGNRAVSCQPPLDTLPSTDDLALAVTCSSMVNPHELVLALFQPDIAIDGSGRTMRLHPVDFSAFLALAPKESTAWRVRSAASCGALFVVLAPGGVCASVDNWNLRTRELNGGGELPEDVWALIKEAQEVGDELELRLGVGDPARARARRIHAVLDLIGRKRYEDGQR